MYKTKNDLPETTRVKICELLNARLADSIDLMMQAKQAHWNVKGMNFIALHELFDSIVDHTTENVDTIAERITQLGGIAEGTIRAATKRTTLPDYSLTISDGRDHVDTLSTAIATLGKSVRHAIDLSDELKDKDTADLFTGVSRSLDKDLWFLEAHLHGSK
jgi:starvation-inducible DNA-binding protein